MRMNGAVVRTAIQPAAVLHPFCTASASPGYIILPV
jgi:hypothetical protein